MRIIFVNTHLYNKLYGLFIFSCSIDADCLYSMLADRSYIGMAYIKNSGDSTVTLIHLHCDVFFNNRFLILHQWLYPNDIVSCLIWSIVFGGVFAVCSLPASLYVKKGLYLKYLCPQFLKSKVSKPTSSGITISSSLTAMTTLSIPPPYTYAYRCSSGVISV